LIHFNLKYILKARQIQHFKLSKKGHFEAL
jgi:hypothetical protein